MKNYFRLRLLRLPPWRSLHCARAPESPTPPAVLKKPYFGGARPRNDNRLQPGEPLGCLVRERGSPIWISNQGANMARFIR
jgi:hypothetical protein